LRGGELAAHAAHEYLNGGNEDSDALRSYERARRAEFGGKWWVERLIGAGVACPPVMNRAAKRLASRPHLADLLVGVTGDFVPARRVLSASYLSALFLSRVIPTPDVAWQ
jgi:flavin-dependent dehydrogenase